MKTKTNNKDIGNDVIEGYYDEYVARQVRTGVNNRHRAITKFARSKCGLNSHSKLLEIGCGVGTATSLFADIITSGSILAVDISPKSIETAKQVLGNANNIEFRVSDMSDFDEPSSFDIIILPDVLEHIPREQHKNLFERLERSLTKDGTILINIPDADYTDYIRDNQPELLQVVDQSLRFADFADALAGTNLDVICWERYSIFMKPFDYRRIILKKDKELLFESKKENFASKVIRKIRKIISK